MIKKIKERINDKKLTRPLLVAMLVVVLILGGTFAWLRIGLNGTKNNIIKAGLLDLIIDESPTDGDTVRLERAIPQSYREGLTNAPYRFTLVNNSTIDTDYTISLEDYYVGSDANLTSNDKLSDSLIRYILVKNDDELVATNSHLLSEGRTIDIGTISGKVGNEATAIPYTLYIWIDSKAGDDSTESDIMGKIFNARLKLEAEQNHESAINSYNVGDVVLFNPVTADYCENGSNCKDFVVISKEEDASINIMYLDEETNMTTGNGSRTTFQILEDVTENWSSDLIVDTKYDLPSSTTMPPFGGYSYNKARLPLTSEMTSEVAETLKENGIADMKTGDASFVITAYNDTNFGMFGIIHDGDPYSNPGAPYGTYMSSSDENRFYIHPVINVGGDKEEDVFKISIPDGRTKDTLQDGDMVCLEKRSIGKECFDFMRYEGNNMILMAMYNLNVGDNPFVEETFKQSPNAKAYDYNQGGDAYGYGGVFFCADDYWYEDSFRPKSKYGDSFPADVYDETYDTAPDFSNAGYNTPGYSVAYYVKRYKTILESMGANISKARLYTYQEAVDFGCSDDGWGNGWKCPDSPYLHRTSYWIGTAYSSVHVNIKFNTNGWGHYYGNPEGDPGITTPRFGVRPVIEMNKNQIN